MTFQFISRCSASLAALTTTIGTSTATSGGYRCCCGSDDPSFVLSLVAHSHVGELPKFKLRMPVADSASSTGGGVVEEATLSGYVVRNLGGGFGFNVYDRLTSYRLVYRAKNGSGETLPSASIQPHNDDVIEGTAFDAEREERRLMATEESRQRYSVERF